MVIIFLAKNGDILIVGDWRGGGEIQREEVKFHGVHREDQGLCSILCVGGCYCPVCLFVCANIGTRSFVQHTVTYRSERSEWPVMSNSRERIQRDVYYYM